MRISDLPPGLRELAENRMKEFPSGYIPREGSMIKLDTTNINWFQTEEGFLFWKRIHYGDFTPFYNCRVVNFKLKDK